MKKLFLIAAALTALVSCTKTEVIPEETAMQEITMKAYNQAAVKAMGPVNEATLPPDNETMTIYGYYAADGTAYSEDAYLYGVTFGYSDDVWKGGSWSGGNFTANPYYWPYIGKMKFIAVYPTDYPKTSGGVINCEYTTTDETQTPAVITPTTTISKVNLSVFSTQKDIMYSSNLYTDADAVDCPSVNAQELEFKHLLSQVVVAVKPAVANQIKVTAVKWKNAYVKGDIIVEEPFEVTYDYDAEPKADVVYDLVEDVKPNNGIVSNSNFIPVSAKGALVLPTGANIPVLSITYSLADGSGSVTKEVTISEQWAQGKKYIYNVTINLNEITFTAEVEEWDEQTPVTPSI